MSRGQILPKATNTPEPSWVVFQRSISSRFVSTLGNNFPPKRGNGSKNGARMPPGRAFRGKILWPANFCQTARGLTIRTGATLEATKGFSAHFRSKARYLIRKNHHTTIQFCHRLMDDQLPGCATKSFTLCCVAPLCTGDCSLSSRRTVPIFQSFPSDSTEECSPDSSAHP